MNLEKITLQVCNIAREVGFFIKDHVNRLSATDIEHKGQHDFVSFVDKESERRIIAMLEKILPEAAFIVEENTIEQQEKELIWIVDPLDGTTNFIHGVPCYSVSIALMQRNEIVCGVVHEINLDETFYAWKGAHAMMNKKPISVSDNADMQKSLFATGFPYSDYSRLNGYLEVFNYLVRNTNGIRRLGSAAVDLAYVACGRYDAFFEYSLHPWDVAAGAFIVQSAGGKVSDFKGGQNFIFGEELIATNAHIFKDFLPLVKKHLP